jgi:hypothetical protein
MSMFGSLFGRGGGTSVNSLLENSVEHETLYSALDTELAASRNRRSNNYTDEDGEEDEDDEKKNDTDGGLASDFDHFDVESISSVSSVSVGGSTRPSSRARQRERRRRQRNNRDRSPPPLVVTRPPIVIQHPEPVHQHFGNDGLANAGVFAGVLGTMQQAVHPSDPEANEREAFDPCQEDWSSCIFEDREDGVDFDFCFFCVFSQCSQEKEKNPDYMRLLRIVKENHGKLPFVKLARIVRDTYNNKIRKHKPDLYKKWALTTIRDHFTKHTINLDVIQNNTARILNTMMEMTAKNGVFTRDRVTKGKEDIDDKAVKRLFTLHSKLVTILSTKSKSKSSKNLI